MLRFFSYVIAFVLIVIAVTFAYLNANDVIVNYYLGSVHLPLSLLLIIALGLGIILGCLAAIPTWLRLKKDIRILKKQLKQTKPA